jgi:beta-galactosidase
MNNTIHSRHAALLACALLFPTAAALAAFETDTLLTVDASAPVTAPLEGHLKQGSSRSPQGATIGINSRYLTRAGKPWLPVMGEFHYTRTPAAQWELELRKMKAAGVDVVASYIIWNHHEEQEGKFDWSGRRDLRRFVELCRKVGLDFVVRVGPWAHAEVRYGGVPDWVVDAMPTRGDDPQYLGYVERFYAQIGQQLRGLLWKDGGPVIGLQIENEYNLRGEGQGAAHIATLKKLVLKAGLDVPLYTVTGWDGTVYPPGEVTPVFGGYIDEPWATSTKELPPKETHAFRFDTRVSGDLGAQTASHGKGTADQEIDKTPFLGAEYGPGLPFMYRRRPVLSADDVASMLPVQLGSGLNLLGYYMFHGGRNPEGRTWLQESSGSGGYNDLPLINYDFQAPLGPDGQQRPVLARLRPYHWFLHDFGAQLAPMTVRRPDLVPASRTDLKTPRFAVRSQGKSGFVFMNNHVRQYAMAPQQGVRFSVKLPGETLVFPSKPVDVADGDYFIWPFHLDLDSTDLRYATAQPMARIDAGKEGIVYVFAAHKTIPVEFGFDAGAAGSIDVAGARKAAGESGLVIEAIQPGTAAAITIRKAGARPVRIVVLSAAQAEQVSIEQVAGQRRLLLSAQQVVVADKALQLRSVGQPHFHMKVFPALAKPLVGTRAGQDGIFQTFDADVPERRIAATVTPVRAAREAPPIKIGGPARAAVEPTPESFKAAASWQIAVPRAQLKGLDDTLLNIDFVGDIGRLYSGVRMLDDWYYSGYGWQFGLREAEASLDRPLTLSVLPLRADAPVYIPKEGRPDFKGKSQVAELRGVSVTPVYLLTLTP